MTTPNAMMRRRSAIGAAVEATEGSAETLAAANANIVVFDPKFDANISMFDRNPARAYLSRLAAIIGMQAARIQFRSELKGSGSVTTLPSWDPIVRASGFARNYVSKVSIGAVTTGPFIPGETITQTTSGATGRVVGECATGASFIWFVPLSGSMRNGLLITGGTSGATATTGATGANMRIAIGAIAGGPFQNAETITGGTSGATAKVVGATVNGAAYIVITMLSGTFVSGETITGGTSTATAPLTADPVGNMGYEYTCTSKTAPPSATIARYMAGVRQFIHGARGNLKFSAASGLPIWMDFDFLGVYNAVTDVAVPEPSSTDWEATLPAAYLNAGLSIGGYTPVFTTLGLDMKNVLTPRENANSTKGLLSVFIADRNPSGSIDPELTLVSDQDWYGKWVAGTLGRLATVSGTGAGSTVWLACPNVQTMDVGDGNRGGIAVADVGFGAKTRVIYGGDDEVIIAMI